ncbi:MAG: hypothetical protein JWL73_146 [Actinomycetia bacterium]|nr:hypothetical protein [Actinomycetes bacterium]
MSPTSPTDRDIPEGKISKADIEAKLAAIQGGVVQVERDVKSLVIAAGIVVGSIVLAGAFILGRRKGRKRSGYIEIRQL